MDKANPFTLKSAKSVNSQLEILREVTKSENIYKSVSYFLIAIFFALIATLNIILTRNGRPLSDINSSPATISNYNLSEIYWSIYLLAISIGSITTILFMGRSFKIAWVKLYYSSLILSTLTLIIAIIISATVASAIDLPLSEYTQKRANLYLGLGIAVSLIEFLILLFLAIKTRFPFPNSHTRALLLFPLYIIFIVFAAILRQWVFAINDNQAQVTAFSIVMIVISVIALIYVINVVIFANLYKENIISNITNRELDTISRNQDLSFVGSIITGSLLAIFPIVISSTVLTNTDTNFTNFIIGTVITVFLVLAYFYIISKRSKINFKKSDLTSATKRKFFVSKKHVTNALENQILYIFVLTLIVIINSILIAFANSKNTLPQNSSIFLLLVMGLAIIAIVGFNNLKGIKFPNIKNLTSTVIVLLLAIFNVLIALIYSSVPNKDAIFALLRIEIGLLFALTTALSYIVLLVVNLFIVYLATAHKKSAIQTLKKTLSTKKEESLKPELEPQAKAPQAKAKREQTLEAALN